jgi:hypothetical protein
VNPTHQPRLRILPWSGPISTDEVDARHEYCDTYWLPLIRPAAFVLGRRLVSLSLRFGVHEGKELYVEADVLAPALGLVPGTGENELRLYRSALERLDRHRLVRFQGANLEVRLTWPRLASHMLARLPVPMQHVEPDWWKLAAGVKAEFVEVQR